jgi:hypothetical protein
MSGNTDELMLVEHASTDAAVLLSEDGEEKTAQWVAKALIDQYEYQPGTINNCRIVEVTMREWVAKQKGFI